jgi:hypothetical protein
MINTAWFQKHKTELMVGGAGVAVTVALYLRSKANASGTTGTAATTSSYLPQTTADTTDTDLYDSLEGQVQGLSAAVANNTAANQNQGFTAPTNEQLFGSGYGAPGSQEEYATSSSPVGDAGGGQYYQLNDQQIWSDVTAGDTIYSQVEPGVFQPTTNVNSGPDFLKSST